MTGDIKGRGGECPNKDCGRKWITSGHIAFLLSVMQERFWTTQGAGVEAGSGSGACAEAFAEKLAHDPSFAHGPLS